MPKTITIHDIARRAGVSTATVSHVINHTRWVSKELQESVRTAMEELGYVPNALARGLRARCTNTIGLVVPNSANPFYADVARGIENAVAEQGFNVILCNTERSLEREILATNNLFNQRVAGIIYAGSWVGSHLDHIQTLCKRGTPVVFIDRYTFDLPVGSVIGDNRLGGWMAANHLIRLGHRRIACIAGYPENTPNENRPLGFQQALREAGFSADAAPVVKADFQFEGGYQAAVQLLNAPRRPTAIFACNDLMAIGAMRAAFELGLKVPGDISLVGYDNTSLAQYVNPPLTSVDHLAASLGSMAAAMLLENIHDPQLPVRAEIVPPELVVRQSTAGWREEQTA